MFEPAFCKTMTSKIRVRANISGEIPKERSTSHFGLNLWASGRPTQHLIKSADSLCCLFSDAENLTFPINVYKSTLGLIDVTNSLANSCSLGLLQVYEMMGLAGGIKGLRSEKVVPEVLLSVAKTSMILIREPRLNMPTILARSSSMNSICPTLI